MKKIILMFLLTSLAIGQSSTLYFTDGKTLEGELVDQSKDGIIFKVADPNKINYPLGSIQTMVDRRTFIFKDKFIMKIADSSGIQIYPEIRPPSIPRIFVSAVIGSAVGFVTGALVSQFEFMGAVIGSTTMSALLATALAHKTSNMNDGFTRTLLLTELVAGSVGLLSWWVETTSLEPILPVLFFFAAPVTITITAVKSVNSEIKKQDG